MAIKAVSILIGFGIGLFHLYLFYMCFAKAIKVPEKCEKNVSPQCDNQDLTKSLDPPKCQEKSIFQRIILIVGLVRVLFTAFIAILAIKLMHMSPIFLGLGMIAAFFSVRLYYVLSLRQHSGSDDPRRV